MSTHITIETTVREIILVEEDVTEEEAKELRPDAIRKMGPIVGKAEIESVVTAAHILVPNNTIRKELHKYVVDEADAMSQAGSIPSQLKDLLARKKAIAEEDAELCANGRPHPGGNMPPEFYKYDMTDDEWYGDHDA